MFTFTKLRSGQWGIKGDAAAAVVGARVPVMKKSGRTSEVEIARVLWQGATESGEVAICAIVAEERPARGRRPSAPPPAAPQGHDYGMSQAQEDAGFDASYADERMF